MSSLTLDEAVDRALTLPPRLAIFQLLLVRFQAALQFFITFGGLFFLFFLLHSLLFWIDRDPEQAFDYGALLLGFLETTWDLVALLYNIVAELGNSAFFPLWNAFVFHAVTPGVTLVLEVFTQIFFQKPYEGVISDFDFGGYFCDLNDPASASFCGRFDAYEARLQQGNSKTKTDSVVFGPQTARRLSEALDTSTLDLGPLIGALDGLVTDLVLFGATAFDLALGVAYDVLSTSAQFLIDAVWTILTTLFDTLKLLIDSGFLQTLLGIGVDFFVILVTELSIPMLIAQVDALICALQFFLWNTWKAQLQCAELHCFRGADAASDWWIFSSVPIVTERFASIVSATLNSRTARRFTKNAGNIDIEGISSLGKTLPTLAGSACRQCFTCRFPEIRAVWFVSALTISLFNPDNFERFYGNVTQTCMSNGSYYEQVLCGPRGSEQLSFNVWKDRYKRGYQQFDIDIVQSYAEKMITRGTLMGGSAGGSDAEGALDAGNAWFERDQTLPHDEQAARFTHAMCRMWRESDAGNSNSDVAHRYSEHPSGSIAYVTSSWALESCKRCAGPQTPVLGPPLTHTPYAPQVQVRSVWRRLEGPPQLWTRSGAVFRRPRGVQEGHGSLPGRVRGRHDFTTEVRLQHDRVDLGAQPGRHRLRRLRRRSRELHREKRADRSRALRRRRLLRRIRGARAPQLGPDRAAKLLVRAVPAQLRRDPAGARALARTRLSRRRMAASLRYAPPGPSAAP